MACFTVPAAEAIVVGVAYLAVKHSENKVTVKANPGSSAVSEEKIPFSRKLGWLFNLLMGGAFLLAFEHLWHGEVVPWYPFLTAMADAADKAEMLHEMSTVGVTMAIAVTAVWGVMLAVSRSLEKRSSKESKVEENAV